MRRLKALLDGLGAWTTHPTRSLSIFGIGAVLGLILAGFGLFTAKGGAARIVPPEDVALVNRRPILLSDFNAQLEAQYSAPIGQITPAERRATLNDMIREELFVQRGLELDMPSSDPDVRSALVAAVEQQVTASVTARKLDEAALRAYYEAHRDAYATEGVMAVQDLVAPLGSRSRAEAAAAALRAGRPVQAVAAALNLKSTGKVDGEEFYFAARIHLGPRLFEVARMLPTGGVSAPVALADGVHILVMIKNIAPTPQTFESAESRVEADSAKDARDRLAAGELKYLRDKAEILIAPALR